MIPLHYSPRSRTFFLAALFALAETGCTFGATENMRDLVATGPELGWTVLALEQTSLGLSTVSVTAAIDGGVLPTARATITMVAPANGSSRASDEVLDATFFAFGEPAAQGSEMLLPLMLMPMSVEERPRILQLRLWVPRARGVSVDVRDTPVYVDGLDGPVSVTATNAEVVITVTGTATVNDSNGSVRGTVGGGVVTTSNADVDLDWTAASDLDVDSSNGVVTIQVPADAGVTFDLDSSDISFFGGTATGHLVQSRNGGGRRLHVTTNHSAIGIR